jgi:hypothetical protein
MAREPQPSRKKAQQERLGAIPTQHAVAPPRRAMEAEVPAARNLRSTAAGSKRAVKCATAYRWISQVVADQDERQVVLEVLRGAGA